MLEIVFGESAAGALKIAQGFGRGEYAGGCTSLFIRHGTAAPRPRRRSSRSGASSRRSSAENGRRPCPWRAMHGMCSPFP